jgi:hypothetical protein
MALTTVLAFSGWTTCARWRLMTGSPEILCVRVLRRLYHITPQTVNSLEQYTDGITMKYALAQCVMISLDVVLRSIGDSAIKANETFEREQMSGVILLSPARPARFFYIRAFPSRRPETFHYFASKICLTSSSAKNSAIVSTP